MTDLGNWQLLGSRSDEVLYEFCVLLPFKISCAPALFQEILSGIFVGIVSVYLDDIIIHSSAEDHLKIFEEVFNKFEEANLVVNESKWAFGRRKIEYLGYQIEYGKISALLDKVESVRRWPAPNSNKRVRRFWEPLSEVHSKGCKPGWTIATSVEEKNWVWLGRRSNWIFWKSFRV